MSFILDALKKSEAERQQKNAPGIASIPESGRKQSASKWVWIIGVLLVANLAAFGYLVLKPEPADPPPDQEPAISTQPLGAPAEATAGPVIQQASPALVETPPPATVDTAPAEPAAEFTIPGPAAEPLPTVVDGPASFNELRAQGVLQLSDLHLDIHVYSGTPADRFVFINMSKYTENSTLAEGPTVREITPDGVVLDYRGTRFLLPRE